MQKFSRNVSSILRKLFLFFYVRRLSKRALEAFFEEARAYLRLAKVEQKLQVFRKIEKWLEENITILDRLERKLLRVREILKNEREEFVGNELNQFETAAGHALLLPQVNSKIRRKIEEKDAQRSLERFLEGKDLKNLLEQDDTEVAEQITFICKEIFGFLKNLSLEAFLNEYLSQEEFENIANWLLEDSSYLIPIKNIRPQRVYHLVFIDGGENSGLKEKLCQVNPDFRNFEFRNSHNKKRLEVFQVAVGINLDDLTKQYEQDYLTYTPDERIFFQTGIKGKEDEK